MNVKSNKNDANDADAICEAMSRPNMRYVKAKTVEQQDIQAAHRIRGELKDHRNAKANYIRGLVTEYGLVAPHQFHLATINRAGKFIKRKKLPRRQVRQYFTQLERSKIAMEACASAHFWGREFRKMGYEVVLLPPQHVKDYLRGQKNDYNDALAIAESTLHGTIRPVTIKCVEQQIAN